MDLTQNLRLKRLAPYAHALLYNANGALLLALFSIFTSRWLTPNDRGQVLLIMSLANTLGILLSFGFAIEGRRKLANRSQTHFIQETSSVIFTSAFVSFLIGCLFVILEKQDFPIYFVPLLSLMTAFSAGTVLFREALFSREEFAKVNYAIGISWVTQLVGLIILHALNALTVATTLILVTVIGGIFLVIIGIYTKRVLQEDFGQSRLKNITKLPKFYLSPWLVSIISQYFLSGDRVLIGLLGSTTDLAIYAVGATLASIPLWISSAFSQVIQTRTSGNHGFKPTFKVSALTIFLVFLVGVFIYLAAPELIEFIFGTPYSSAVLITRVLLPSTLLWSMYVQLQGVRLGSGSYKILNFSGLAGVFTNITLMVILVPKMGSLGGAVSTLTSSCITLLAFGVARNYGRRKRASLERHSRP